MSKSDAYENALQKLLFNNTAFANVGDAGGLLPSAAAGNLYVSLHTANPGEAGDQTTSETSYGAYARVAVVRSAGGWTISTNTSSNAAAITFPECTSGSATLTYFGIGTASSGAGILLHYGALTSSLAVSLGIAPYFAIGDLTTTED